MQKKLKITDFISIFFRSFFIQAVWNFQSMLAVGFSYSLVPVAKRLFKSKMDRKKFFERHLNFFNAHPYFSSFALGAIARIEEDYVLTGKSDYQKIERLKNALIGPLGAIGDQVVWATLKPASILVGVLGVLVIQDFKSKIIFLMLILILYNVPHLYIRFFGILKGYNLGFNVYKLLNLDNFKAYKLFYAGIGALSLGLFTGFTIVIYSNINFRYFIIFIVSIMSAYIYKKWKQSFYGSIIFPLMLSILMGVILESI